MTLFEVVSQLETLPDDFTIYADRVDGELNGSSPALVTKVDTPCDVTIDGRITQIVNGRQMECVLSVAEAKKVVDVLRRWSGDRDPTAETRLDAVLYYRTHLSYLPVGNYYSEEHAEPIDIGVEWDTGAPLPVLMANDYRTFLVFYLKASDPDWDGTYVHVRQPASDTEQSIAVVEFQACRAAMLGDPNEEVINGHRLWGKGLRLYGAHIVRNSDWVAELQRMNQLHVNYQDPKFLRGEYYFRPPAWEKMNHYLISFHDSTFECVAEGYTVRKVSSSMPKVLQEVLEDLLS